MKKNIIIIIGLVLVSFLIATQTDFFSDSDAIGKIDGQPVSKEQFDAYLKFKRINVKDDEHRAYLVEQYLEREALMREIVGQGILDQAFIEAEINDFKQQMYISRYFEQYLADAVSDDAVKNFYVANAADYQHKQAHVAHILFRLNAGMSETERLAKQTAVQDVYSKLKAEKDFAELANEVSEDKHSAVKGGDLGWLKEGAISELFTKTAFALEKGQVSSPFETPFGFHIVKLIDAPKIVKKPFEAVKGDIRYKLRQQAKSAQIDRLQSEMDIVINDN